MPKWTKPSEGLPEVEDGDRVIVIVQHQSKWSDKPKLVFSAVILEATEYGWEDPDDTGYTPADGVLWTTERDLCGVAEFLKAKGEI